MWRLPLGISYFAGLPDSLLLSCLLIAGAVAVLVAFRPQLAARNDARFWPLLLLGVQLSLSFLFLRELGGGMIFSDDHPSFLYRFHLLHRAFPFIPLYNTDWNAGLITRELFSSGAQLLWYLGFPFVQLLGRLETPEQATRYSLLIPYLFLILLPWSSYFAARLFDQSRCTAAVSALFTLLPTTMFSEWVLGFGTIAFSSAMALVPLVVALALRVIYRPELSSLRHRLALVAALWICLCWPLSFICFIPVGVALLFQLPGLLRSRMLWQSIWPFLLVALLHLPNAVTLLHGGKVTALLARDSLPGAHQTVSAADREVRSDISLARMAQRINPVLIIFSLPGLLALRSCRRTLGATAVWLIAVSIVGIHFKPQLELPRLVIPAAFLLCMPAALGVLQLFHAAVARLQHADAQPAAKVCAALLVSLAIVSILSAPAAAATAYTNRSSYRFVAAPPLLGNLTRAVREHGGTGRTFISSFILHDFGAADYRSQDGGHVALLPALSGKPFYASHFYHMYWNTVDPIPRSFRDRGRDGIEEFLDLINATAVISFRREWAQYFQKNPRYREVFNEGRFRLFTREPAAGGYFLEGTGEVRQTPTGFQVLPASEVTVLKFRYHPLLEAVGAEGAKIEPSFVFDEEVGSRESAPVSYIRLTVPPALVAAKQPIEIRSRWPAF